MCQGLGWALSIDDLFTKWNHYLKSGALTPEVALCPALGSDERIYAHLLLQETAAGEVVADVAGDFPN